MRTQRPGTARIGLSSAALVAALAAASPLPAAALADAAAGGAEQGAALTLRVTSTPARVRGGRGLTYAITVRSAGPQAALDVKVCDRLPAGVSYIRAFDRGVLRAGTVCWTIEALEAGRSRTVSVLVRARPRRTVRTIRNVATATAANAASVSASVRTIVLRGGAGL